MPSPGKLCDLCWLPRGADHRFLWSASAALAALLLASSTSASTFSFHIAGDNPGPWPNILSSVGLTTNGPTNLFILRNSATGSAAQWIDKIEKGAVVVVEGESDLAAALGIRPSNKHVVVRSIVDTRAPKLPIVWEKSAEIPVFLLPKDARVFATERWEGAPVLAAVKRGWGSLLWLATSPGDQGSERYPYLVQALVDVGISPPFRSARLTAFFDSAYRSRVDLDYFATRWRQAGIAALHVAAWHYFEPDAQGDEYLKKLIAACHRNGILVYAWLELPHVSERFWADHPEWREKTALLQDAQLDWRKLMNLQNTAAFAATAKGTRALLDRFDWDGVNLAELYFESLEGVANAARFTPMNDDVRREFAQTGGFDPLTLFQSSSPDTTRMRAFLDYRAALASKLQSQWIAEIETLRRGKPDLDLVLTHVDDRFDNRMRDLIGADAGRVLPLLDQHDFTFLIEDPATIWNLGPQRYPQIAERYRPLTNRFEKLAIDINIVERYQDVYPTKQQTGTELFQLVHLASKSFPQVALYFENSITAPDLPLLAAAAASVDRVEREGDRLTVASKYGVGVRWQGPATVNGRLWPVHDAETLWLPPGANRIEPAAKDAPVRILDFNGRLQSARSLDNGVELSYQSSARAIAVLNVRPGSMELDGVRRDPAVIESSGKFVVTLPRGQHLVTFLTP
jgi:predicted secreted protein